MKKWLLIVAAMPVIAYSQPNSKTKTPITQKTTAKAAPAVQKGFLIEGKFEGTPNGTEVLMYKNGENVEMAKTTVQGGKFVLKGSLPEPTLCFVIVGSAKPVEMYVENTTISLKNKGGEPPVYDVEGSPSHKDFAAFLKVFMPYVNQTTSLANTLNATAPGAARDSLMLVYNKAQSEMQKVIDKLVTEKSKSIVTAFLLHATYRFNEDIVMLENRFNQLDAKVRGSEAGIALKDFIAEERIGAIGTEALDFSQPDTAGAAIALSSFRGKYVLVDFWASWCGPCRNENPNVVENFQKFKSKNFTVLGVSLDRPGQKDRWMNAIKEDGLTWTHVSDLKWWDNAAAQLYKVKGIPQNFLVDPQGRIVAKNLRGAALEAKLCELLGCN